MPEVWTRTKWNEEIIQEVNRIIEENSVCENILQIEPLEEVDPKHVWHKEEDVQLVRDKLIEICPLNEEFEFSEDIPDVWKQQTIDEFEEAIQRGCQGISETFTITFIPGVLFTPDQYVGGPQVYFAQLYPWGDDIQLEYDGLNSTVNSWSVSIDGSMIAFGAVEDGVLVGAAGGEYDGRAAPFELTYTFSCRYEDEYA